MLASQSESLSNFLIEAQLHGLPAVAYDIVGVGECFVPSRSGDLIPNLDQAAFITALDRLIREPALRKRYAEQAQRHARANFVTTRYNTEDFRYATMATMHEAGHSMYELNLPRTLAFAPVGFARGMSAHESQSLMLEMMAGRSREFIGHFAGLLHEYLGGDADGWAPVNLLNFMRRVDDDYIRVEADEISYPLHVILRYRLERALLSGDLAVDDIPGAWNNLFDKLFGRVPPDDARGCLQDIHWAAGLFGYFPNYALGESLGAQLYERATADDPSILPAIARGDFRPYFAWVKPRIHEQASLKPFDEIVMAATGAKLSGAALKRHLKKRYLDEPLA